MAAAYPILAEFTAFLTNSRIPASTVTALATQGALLAGIRAFERDCARHFLAGKDIENADLGTAGVETRYFDSPVPDTGVLDFGRYGDLATLTSVTYVPLGSTPQTLTLNDNFFLLEENAPSIGEPWTALKFRWGSWPVFWYSSWDSAWRQGTRAIQIAGKWGFGLEIPDDAWQAMMMAAVLQVEGQFRLGATRGGMTGWKAADVSVEYGVESYTNITKAWQGMYQAAVARYAKVSF